MKRRNKSALAFLLVLILTFCFGCTPQTDKSSGTRDIIPTENVTTATSDTSPTDEPTPTPTPEPVLPIGIYTKDRTKGVHYDKISEYVSDWPTSPSDSRWTYDDWTYAGRVNRIWDIRSFFIFTSVNDVQELPAGQHWGDWWMSTWDANVANVSARKMHIGFSFTIKLKDGGTNFYGEGDTVYNRVLGPEDTFDLEEYFELYLYDDPAHQNDSWYSHVEAGDMTDDTHFTSIKLTAREGIKYVESITLEAFLYGGETDFGEGGHYTGANSASVLIYHS